MPPSKAAPPPAGTFNPQLALQAMQATGTGFPGVGAALYAARNPAATEDKATLKAQDALLDFIKEQIKIGGDVPEEAIAGISKDENIRSALRAITLQGQREQLSQRLGRHAYNTVSQSQQIIANRAGGDERTPILAEEGDVLRQSDQAQDYLRQAEAQTSENPTIAAVALGSQNITAGTGRHQLTLEQAKEARLAGEAQLKQQQDWSTAVSQLMDDIRASGRSPQFQAQVQKLASQVPQGNYHSLQLLNAQVQKYDLAVNMLGESDRAYFVQELHKIGIDPLTADFSDPQVAQAAARAKVKSKQDMAAIARQNGLDAKLAELEADKNRPWIFSDHPEEVKLIYDKESGLPAATNIAATKNQIAQNPNNVSVRRPDLAKDMDNLEKVVPFLNKVSELTVKTWGPGGVLERAADGGLFGAKTAAGVLSFLVKAKGTAGMSPQEKQAYTDYKTYDSFIKGNAPQVRALVKDVGSVSDFDRDAMTGLFAETGQRSLFTVPDTKDVAYQKPRLMQDVINRTQGAIINPGGQYTNKRIKSPEEYEKDIVESKKTPEQRAAEAAVRKAADDLIRTVTPTAQPPQEPSTSGAILPPRKKR